MFNTVRRLTLAVVVEESVGNGDPLRSVSDIEKTIVVVFTMVKVGRQVKVITPDILRSLDTNSITIGGKHLAALEVTENDIFNLVDIEANVLQSRVAVQADDGGVRGDLDFSVARDLARDVNNSRLLCSGSLGELCKSRDCGGCSTLTTSSFAVGRSLSDGTRRNSSLVDVAMGSCNSHRSKRRQGDGRSELHFSS